MPSTALIVTDMLNRYEHPDADALIRSVRSSLPAVRQLIAESRRRDVQVVYVNDNHDDWCAGRAEIVEYALGGPEPELVEPIIPPDDIPFVVKARHSAFYETQLDYFLRHQEIERLILVGQVTEQCILYSALDAYVRHYRVVVARDAVAHIHQDLADASLRMMERNMRAEIVTADSAFDDGQ